MSHRLPQCLDNTSASSEALQHCLCNRVPSIIRLAQQRIARCTRYVALHPLRRAAPVAWRCTRYVALHLLRNAAPDQNGCNAYGSGAAHQNTSTETKSTRTLRDTTPTRSGFSAQSPIEGTAKPETTQKTQRSTSPETLYSGRITAFPPGGGQHRATPTHISTQHAAPVTERYTRCVAPHPLRGAAPVTRLCTRSERVQCLRIGCSASPSSALPLHIKPKGACLVAVPMRRVPEGCEAWLRCP